MPELPEVETVCRGLNKILKFPDETIEKIEVGSRPLRYGPDPKLVKKLSGQKWSGIRRRAKYLLFELDDYTILSHLGMTGSWRLEKDKRKHDHIRIYLSDGRVLTYHDARRFGMFEVFKKQEIEANPKLLGLGPDPVVDKGFNGDYLFQQSRKKDTSLKAFIMNQAVVVGVGNIYASEALFLSGLNPKMKAKKLSRRKAELLARSIVEVLNEAIDWGGTTISDFKQAGGSEGYFQNLLMVYGRDKEECVFCQSMLRSQAIVGRNSFWCPKCQKL